MHIALARIVTSRTCQDYIVASAGILEKGQPVLKYNECFGVQFSYTKNTAEELLS